MSRVSSRGVKTRIVMHVMESYSRVRCELPDALFRILSVIFVVLYAITIT